MFSPISFFVMESKKKHHFFGGACSQVFFGWFGGARARLQQSKNCFFRLGQPPGPARAGKKNKIVHNSATKGSQGPKMMFDIVIFDEDGTMKNLQACQNYRKWGRAKN